MKRLYFLFVVLSTSTGMWAQTTRIVNNNPGASGGINVYTGATALQTAINASVSGDIIHIVASSVSNGDVSIQDKSLTFLGVGLNPQKGVGTRSLVGVISMNGAASSGTRFSGLHFTRINLCYNTSVVHTISNILIENCQFGAISQAANSNSIGNLIIRNCVINTHPGFTSSPSIEIKTNSGVLITNNIVRASTTSACTVSGDGLTVQNNLFYGNGTSQYVFTSLTNSVVNNNIFSRVSATLGGNLTNVGNSLSNNIVFGAPDNTFTNGPQGNVAANNIAADPLLTNVPSVNGDWLYTYDITLLPGSPAINAGFDGTNMGPTGGTIPFDPEGTLLPLIESINMPTIVTKGVDLKVNVKAKGN